MTTQPTILLVGSGGREHAIAKALTASSTKCEIVCFGTDPNPGLKKLCTFEKGNITNPEAVTAAAAKHGATLAIVGPEAPLATGVADALWKSGIPCVGPKKVYAQLETSKAFTRALMEKYGLSQYSTRFKKFSSMDGVLEWMNELGEGVDHIVLKADGLKGGKGVVVGGIHIKTREEAMQWLTDVFDKGESCLIEERMEGPEFSQISFADSRSLCHMPAVRDFKRAHEGNLGPNTGGMGSISGPHNSLPGLERADIESAQHINCLVIDAVNKEYPDDGGYRGIIYGGYMKTPNGVRVIEFNARFGDPESINLMHLFSGNLVLLLKGVANGCMDAGMALFSSLASVCKYAVPTGYPDAVSVTGQPVTVPASDERDSYVFSSVAMQDDGQLVLCGSRAIAAVASSMYLSDAEVIAEQAISEIEGPVWHRRDIGKTAI